jgi:hypothetical protein
MKKFLILSIVLLILTAWKISDKHGMISWSLKNTGRIGGYNTTVLGNPVLKFEGKDTAIFFNGIKDGLVIPAIPIEGWQKFTIEVLFKPDSDGPVAPRFIHFEDTLKNRGTFELRLTRDAQWYFDGFLKNGRTNKGVTLIDSTRLHPTDQWYWAALVYDGKKMYSYINGKKELEGEMDFPPMTRGDFSLGVRLNKVNWFKGQIRKILFHSEVIAPKKLQDQ